MEEKTPNNFGGLLEEFTNYEPAKVVILPVAFDKTSTWLKGSHKGPEAIIKASQNMELYDRETDSEIYKEGIWTEKQIKAPSSELMIKKVYERVKELLNDQKFVVTLGGEHSVSLGAIKAYIHLFPKMSILHLDAHADRRDSYEGSPYSHACVMARAQEITENIVSVGLRSMDALELAKIDPKRVFYAEEIYSLDGWMKEAVDKLSHDVYISMDLDVFDPGIMPSTGTPEPGGLSWYQVIKLLRIVSKERNIVGFDVVELCPSQNKAPDFLAAKLIYKLLSYKFS